MKEPWN